jgi:penicillin-insensitive murein DD-endopeptidase
MLPLNLNRVTNLTDLARNRALNVDNFVRWFVRFACLLVFFLTLSVASPPPASAGSGGDPFAGWLTDGEAFPLGPHHRLQHHVNKSKTFYATPALIDGLLRAAKAVATEVPGGQPLVVGNLSRKNGGDITDSHTHNSGRDVDLVFFMTQLDGTSVRVRNHHYDAQGRSRRLPKKYTFDLERNWTTIQALANDQETALQWIIMEPHLEVLLLRHAKAQGMSKAQLRRYADMMTLPAYAGRHENHMHIRVQCTVEDWKDRCQPTGPVWPWNTALHREVKARSERMAEDLQSSDRATRSEAIEALWAKGLAPALATALPLLDDSVPQVRRRARKMLSVLVSPESAQDVLNASLSLEPVSRRLVTLWVLRRGGLAGLQVAREIAAGTHPTVSPKPKPTVLRDLQVAARRLLVREEPIAELLGLN